MKQGPFYALIAAGLFGASTPLAKRLLEAEISPWLLAGLLYAGSATGLGVTLIFLSLKRRKFSLYLPKRDWPWLGIATIFGGVLGPIFLMYGLTKTPASSASLFLNLEGVFTAVLAWFAFKEHFDRRIVIGMSLIVLGGVILSLPKDGFEKSYWIGPFFVILACLSWGFDNNFTRKVSTSDAIVLTFVKSFVAGGTNLVLAIAIGATVPTIGLTTSAMTLGFFGYGLSIVLFVLALRHLGASRTGAYFSTAPFIGSLLSILLFPTALDLNLALAGLLMAIGVWLHLSEKHAHEHHHKVLEHTHPHFHDEHHLHIHSGDEAQSEPHTHWHRHEELIHSHPHFPDIHHRHGH